MVIFKSINFHNDLFDLVDSVIEKRKSKRAVGKYVAGGEYIYLFLDRKDNCVHGRKINRYSNSGIGFGCSYCNEEELQYLSKHRDNIENTKLFKHVFDKLLSSYNRHTLTKYLRVSYPNDYVALDELFSDEDYSNIILNGLGDFDDYPEGIYLQCLGNTDKLHPYKLTLEVKDNSIFLIIYGKNGFFKFNEQLCSVERVYPRNKFMMDVCLERFFERYMALTSDIPGQLVYTNNAYGKTNVTLDHLPEVKDVNQFLNAVNEYVGDELYQFIKINRYCKPEEFYYKCIKEGLDKCGENTTLDIATKAKYVFNSDPEKWKADLNERK